MKVPLLVLAVFIITTGLAQELHDLRIVNGIAVDVGPVQAWLAKDKSERGERPMKHWKQVRIVELKEQVASWTKCVVQVEGAPKVELLVANLPDHMRTFFQGLDQQHKAILTLRAAVESDTKKIRLLDGQIPIGAGGDPAWVNSVMAQRSQLETWKANLETLKEELAKGEAAYDEALREGGEKLSVLAMSTGRKYAEIDIWDCGQKKR